MEESKEKQSQKNVDSKENKFKKIKDEVMKQIENKMGEISNDGIQQTNVDYLYKLVDIHKDLKNEDYMMKKEEDNMYRDGEYGYQGYGARGVPGTGRYRTENYGRRGVPGSGRRYRGEDNLDEMKYHYGNYHESGSYGAKEDSAYKMTEAFKDFGYAIAEELEPKDKMMFKQAMQEIMQMMDK